MNDKRNILIIAIYFPPIQHIASNRIYSFAKYLDKDKYNVYVLTIGDKSTSLDNKNLSTIKVIRKPNITIIKEASFTNKDGALKHKLKALHNVAINKLGLDPYRGWTRRCIQDAKEIINKYNIDLVISSYGPLAPHKVALYIKQYYGTKIQWIADMRDELPTNKNLPYKARPWFSNINRLETAILQYADAVTSVSKPILDYFEAISKNNNCIFREIRNGFDFEIPVAKAKSNK